MRFTELLAFRAAQRIILELKNSKTMTRVELTQDTPKRQGLLSSLFHPPTSPVLGASHNLAISFHNRHQSSAHSSHDRSLYV